MIRETIALLVENRPLTEEQAYQTLREIMTGDATDAQIAAFITSLRIRGETPDVIAGCARAMREQFTAIDAPGDTVVDTCGTGGDASNTFNISTAAAFVAAGAGAVVAKHGNKSVSSKSGSADVLQALGLNLSAGPEAISRCLRDVGIAFLFAPGLHPAMKHAIGPRKEVGIRTIFNILGPLSNPAGARHGILGVYSESLVPMIAEAAASLGARHLYVVHGLDGLDEITTTAETLVGEVRDGSCNVMRIHPNDFDIPLAEPGSLRGGTPEENAGIIRDVLAGASGPHRDIVALNAAAAIAAGGRADDLSQGLQLAREAIDSGRAAAKLEALIAAV